MNGEKNEDLAKKTLNDVLLEFSRSEYYQAIRIITVETHKRLLDKLVTIDPHKDPTGISRIQGEIGGIYSLLHHIDYLKEKLVEKKDDNSEEDKSK
jgi:hypothetical protein